RCRCRGSPRALGAGMLSLAGFASTTSPAERRRVVAVLGLAVLGISSSAVIVRGMPDIGPAALAAWRCLGSALVLAPGVTLAARGLTARDLGRTALAGVFL